MTDEDFALVQTEASYAEIGDDEEAYEQRTKIWGNGDNHQNYKRIFNKIL